MQSILFIWYKRSRGILEGGGQGSKRNFEMLSSIVGSDHIDSYYVHDEYKHKTLWSYIQGAFFFLFHYYYGLTPRRVSNIVKQAQQYDCVFIDRSLFGIVAKRLKQSGYDGQILVYFHNVEAIYFDAKLPHLPGRNIIIRTADKNDRYACQYADKIIALNDRDAKVLEQRYGRRADMLIPVTLSDHLTYTPTTELTRSRLQCLFYGAYFTPNNQGILWFVEHVLPHVNIDLKIVGKGMAKLKAESPLLQNIEVISDAPDLQTYIEQADFIVLPIFSGSGMKVKTCEALMYGKNIIGSSEAFEGYIADYDRVGGLCNTAEEFITCINNLATHPRPRFNAYSRQVYLDKYSYAAVQNSFQSLLSHTETAPDSPRIKFFCRSFDLRLYRLSKAFYEKLGYPCVRLTDQSADGYFYTMLADTECDIAINVDEDCFITDPQAVLDLVNYVVANGYANAGCSDGGKEMRIGNPIVTNPFFNVFNLRLIRTRFSRDAVQQFRYTDHKTEMIAAFDTTPLGGHYTFDRPEVIEPYYQFFLWLAANFKTLYLTPKRHHDGTSTLLYDPQGRQLCAHSWLSRFYSVPSCMVKLFQPSAGKQKARIDALIHEAAEMRNGDVLLPTEHWYDTLHFAVDKCIRWVIKVPQRIAAWPAKYRRYHSKD